MICSLFSSQYVRKGRLAFLSSALLVASIGVASSAGAAQPQHFIEPKWPVTPFAQWSGNHGYCGEVGLIQGAMNSGEWMSQYNVRLVCGTGLLQAGDADFITKHPGTTNYNAQLLLEDPHEGDRPFASAGQCLSNARLAHQVYDSAKQPAGIEGYRQFLTWIKSQIRQGRPVTIGVLKRGGGDPQYDHEVEVTKVGTNHDPRDTSYYDDDVLYFDDHSSRLASLAQGYTFGSLAQTRSGANASAQTYSILIPGGSIRTQTGGDGIHLNSRAISATDYGFSVIGPADEDGDTLPVTLAIENSRSNGRENTKRPLEGFNYESPGVGKNTNQPPKLWMDLTLAVTVHDLEPGTSYNLYEYEIDRITGTGVDAALSVPTSRFNYYADRSSQVIHFVASSPSLTREFEISSSQAVAFRCVRANAP